MPDRPKLEALVARIEELEEPHRHCDCGLNMSQYSDQCKECQDREDRLKGEAEDRIFLAELREKERKNA